MELQIVNKNKGEKYEVRGTRETMSAIFYDKVCKENELKYNWGLLPPSPNFWN